MSAHGILNGWAAITDLGGMLIVKLYRERAL